MAGGGSSAGSNLGMAVGDEESPEEATQRVQQQDIQPWMWRLNQEWESVARAKGKRTVPALPASTLDPRRPSQQQWCRAAAKSPDL